MFRKSHSISHCSSLVVFAISGLSFLITATCIPVDVRAQQHVCGIHSSGLHSHPPGIWFNWMIISWQPQWTDPGILVISDVTDWVSIIPDQAHANFTCTPVHVSVNVTATMTHSGMIGTKIEDEFTSGGTAEWAVGPAYAQAKLTANSSQGWTDTLEVTGTDSIGVGVSVISETDVPPGWQYTFKAKKLRRTVRTGQYVADALFECKDTWSGNIETYYCEHRLSVAEAVGFGEDRYTWHDDGKVKDCPNNPPVPLPGQGGG